MNDLETQSFRHFTNLIDKVKRDIFNPLDITERNFSAIGNRQPLQTPPIRQAQLVLNETFRTGFLQSVETIRETFSTYFVDDKSQKRFINNIETAISEFENIYSEFNEMTNIITSTESALVRDIANSYKQLLKTLDLIKNTINDRFR
jgi:hypothetical protein